MANNKKHRKQSKSNKKVSKQRYHNPYSRSEIFYFLTPEDLARARSALYSDNIPSQWKETVYLQKKLLRRLSEIYREIEEGKESLYTSPGYKTSRNLHALGYALYLISHPYYYSSGIKRFLKYLEE